MTCRLQHCQSFFFWISKWQKKKIFIVVRLKLFITFPLKEVSRPRNSLSYVALRYADATLWKNKILFSTINSATLNNLRKKKKKREKKNECLIIVKVFLIIVASMQCKQKGAFFYQLYVFCKCCDVGSVSKSRDRSADSRWPWEFHGLEGECLFFFFFFFFFAVLISWVQVHENCVSGRSCSFNLI